MEDFIRFDRRGDDLPKSKEYWSCDSYAHRQEDIVRVVLSTKGNRPSKNMQYIREGTFPIREDTTMEQLLMLAERIRWKFIIDCFQISIDRSTGEAHMLFDWYDDLCMQSVILNSTQQIMLAVMIIRHLDLPRPKIAEKWNRYFLKSEYEDDPDIYRRILENIKHVRLPGKKYRIVRDMLRYVNQVCRGEVK